MSNLFLRKSILVSLFAGVGGFMMFLEAVPARFGSCMPPCAGYASLSSTYHFDKVAGQFPGGNFWDGILTGEHFGKPVADQTG